MGEQNQAQLQALLRLAAGRLGTTPQALQQAAQNGTLSALLGKNETSTQLQKVLSDPQAAQKLLSTPQAQQLLQQLQQK